MAGTPGQSFSKTVLNIKHLRIAFYHVCLSVTCLKFMIAFGSDLWSEVGEEPQACYRTHIKLREEILCFEYEFVPTRLDSPKTAERMCKMKHKKKLSMILIL
jgi:hypothetical protein